MVLRVQFFGFRCERMRLPFARLINVTIDNLVSSTIDTNNSVDWLARAVALSFSFVNQ